MYTIDYSINLAEEICKSEGVDRGHLHFVATYGKIKNHITNEVRDVADSSEPSCL